MAFLKFTIKDKINIKHFLLVQKLL